MKDEKIIKLATRIGAIYFRAVVIFSFIFCYIIVPYLYFRANPINFWIGAFWYIFTLASLTILFLLSCVIPFGVAILSLYVLPFCGFFLLMSQGLYFLGLLDLLFFIFNSVLTYYSEINLLTLADK